MTRKGRLPIQTVTKLCPDKSRAPRPNPASSVPRLVGEERSRSWGLVSVGVFRRAPGEVVWLSDYYRISCVLTDICGSKQIDSRCRHASKHAAPPTPPVAPSQPQGGLLGGLSGMLQSFQQGGHGDVINSWIGPGQNQPIAPD